MRAVVDTNILIRALLKPSGSVAPILGSLRNGSYTALYSSALLEEVVEVLGRPRFQKKYGIRPQDVEILLALLVMRGEEVAPRRKIETCRDPKDDKFLEVAVEGRADAIVTGDGDLLVLHPFEGVPILTPSAFLARLPLTAIGRE
jgi:putative PIN family toxin of toxin-antitoxin system